MRKFLLVLALLVVSGVAQAQPRTCPTRPAGDNTNACASTAFVHSSVPTSVHGDCTVASDGTITCTHLSSGSVANGVTATTQTLGDNTTKVATDAFVLANSSGVAWGSTANNVPVADGAGSYVMTAIYTLLNNVCSASATRAACVSFMGYADVRWWGCLGNNSFDNKTCIAAALAFMQSTYSGGVVYFIPGTYCTSGLITVTGGAIIKGAGEGITAISSCGADIGVLSFDSSTNHANVESILILGSQSTSATAHIVTVANNVVVNMRNCNIQGGYYALDNNGVDGMILNCTIAATSNTAGAANLHSKGGNWYIRDKFDQSGTNISYAIFLDIPFTGDGNVSENHFDQCDFSGNYTSSAVLIQSGTGVAANTFSSGVIGVTGGAGGAGLTMNAVGYTILSGMEVGGAIALGSASANIAIAASISGGALTVTGTGTCSGAANFNITGRGC